MATDEKPNYEPKDAVSVAIQSTLLMGGAGLFASAVQNTLTKANVSGWGVFSRSGGIIGLFGWFEVVPSRSHTRTNETKPLPAGLTASRRLQLRTCVRRTTAIILQ